MRFPIRVPLPVQRQAALGNVSFVLGRVKGDTHNNYRYSKNTAKSRIFAVAKKGERLPMQNA
jgi:hypothetical protein